MRQTLVSMNPPQAYHTSVALKECYWAGSTYLSGELVVAGIILVAVEAHTRTVILPIRIVNHVVRGANSILIVLADREVLRAKVPVDLKVTDTQGL